jgi:ketosteroid isomerase-like protein
MNDESAIQLQLNRYSDAVSRRDWDAFRTVYTEDAIWQGVDRFNMRFDGIDAIIEAFSRMIDPMSMYVQMNSPSVIQVDGNTAFSRTTIHELGDIPYAGVRFIVYGRYEDNLVKRDNVWLLHRRTFFPITRQTEPIPQDNWNFPK